MAVSFIQHKGQKILLVDYTRCATVQDTIKVLEEVRKVYLNSTESFRSLNDFTNAPSNNEYMELVKKYGKELFDTRTIKNAGVGINGIKRILLSAYNLTVKNKLVPFDSREEALEYLVK
jgi:hypothetical protein